MSDGAAIFSGMEQLQQFPHLQQWLGLAVAGTVELGHIVESPVIRAATSVVPLGWSGIPGDKNSESLKVDISGFRLHLCSLVHAQVNGNWYLHFLLFLNSFCISFGKFFHGSLILSSIVSVLAVAIPVLCTSFLSPLFFLF